MSQSITSANGSVHKKQMCTFFGGGGVGEGGGWGRVVGGGGPLFEVGRLLTFPHHRMGAYSHKYRVKISSCPPLTSTA